MSMPPPPAPPGSTTPPPAPPPTERRSGLALAAMIVGLAGLVLCFTVVPSIVAVVLGLVAARQIRASEGALGGLAAARVGWITGLVGAVLGVSFIVVALAGVFDDGDVAVFDLEPGDCVDFDPGTGVSEIDSITVVDCDEVHTGEVFEVGSLNPDGDRAYLDDDALFAEILDRCTMDRFLEYQVRDVPTRFYPYPIAPDERSWDALGGRFVCLAISDDPDGYVGSLVDG